MQTSDSWFKRMFNEFFRPFFCREDPARISPFDRSSLFFLVVTCIWYFVAYLSHQDVPDISNQGRSGWLDWWDQGQYYKTTAALAQGHLVPSTFWLGYPLLGVPFYWIVPRHPFFVPNLVMALVIAGSFFGSCRRFMGQLEAWALAIIFIFADPVLRDGCLVIPWNTLPAYATLYLSAYLLLFRQPTIAQYALCSFLCGMAVLSRPNEVLPLSVLYLFAVTGLIQWRYRAWALVFFGISLAVAAFITSWVNLDLYHHWSSPYMAGEEVKFSAANYGLKIYQFLCDGAFLTGRAAVIPDLINGGSLAQILERYPVFLLLLPGTIYLVKACGFKAWASRWPSSQPLHFI